MDISVVVEKVGDDGYQATSYVPAHMVAEGHTREEALDRLCDQLRGRLSTAEVVTLSVLTLFLISFDSDPIFVSLLYTSVFRSFRYWSGSRTHPHSDGWS